MLLNFRPTVLAMNEIVIAPLQLLFEYFGAGPGCGGISELRIDEEDSGFRVRFREDITDRRLRTLIKLKSGDDWRSVIAAIERKDYYAFFTDGDTDGEYAWPHLIGTEGPQNYVTDLILCAWAGPPVSQLAEALALASNEQLAQFYKQAGPFRNKRFVKLALKLHETAEEGGLSLAGLVKREAGELSFSELRKDLRSYEKVTDAELEAALKRGAWNVKPYENEIELILNTWKEANAPSSSTGAMGFRPKYNALVGFLREYFVEHGCAPTGEHTLGMRFSSHSISSFTVNFDQIDC